MLPASAPAAQAAPSCVASGANIVCTYSTVGTDTFTVPLGVNSVTFAAFGAQGGSYVGRNPGGLGGSGAVSAAVTPGQVLQVNVGGVGGNQGTAAPNGGFNGGGTGGASGLGDAAGGGGASDVRTAPYGLAHRITVGGGGGGASVHLPGGTGGGEAGGSGDVDGLEDQDGSGGTQSGGGAGGSQGISGRNGEAGTFGLGGDGGGLTGSSGHAGAGGGGGWYGGGGGAHGNFGTGGGGSGFGTSLASGVRSGDGQVTATYAGGQLRVVKALSPAGDPGRFNLQIDGVTEGADAGDGGDTGLETVNPGTHTVGETAGTSTSLSNFTSAIVCKDNDGAGSTVASGSGAGPLNVSVSSGQQIACTIMNTRNAPLVTTAAASSVGSSAATLNGAADPEGSATTGWFRYSTVDPVSCDDSFGTRAPAAGGSALGSGSSPVDYSQAITGLSPATTYYFCAIASNAGGKSFGSVLSFTTASAPSNPIIAPTPAARPAEDPKCKRLQRKLKRQRRNLHHAETEAKRVHIQKNIGKTQRKLGELGC